MNITAAEAPLIVVGLVLYALVWFAVGRRTSPRRRRKQGRPVTPVGERPGQITGDVAAARMTPAEAMAHAAPVDAPPEMERLDATAQIPQYDTIALPAETLNMAPAIPSSVEPWVPPEPRVVLTVVWHRPQGPPVGDQFDVTEPADDPVDEELEIQSLWEILTSQCGMYGGSVKVTVTADGHRIADWADTPYEVWTNECVPVITRACEQLKVAAHA